MTRHPAAHRVPRSPFEPIPDRERCTRCGDPAEWHGPHGCEGDFGHCDCPGLVVAS